MRRFAFLALFLAVGLGACTKSKSERNKSSGALTEKQRQAKASKKSKADRKKKAEARARELKREKESFLRLDAAWADKPPPLPPEDQATRVTNDGLKAYVFSIGQADSLLVVGPPPQHKSLLVDLGSALKQPKNLGANFSSYAHVATRIREITGRSGVDYLVLTHYEKHRTGDWDGKENRGNGMVGLLTDASVPFTVGTFLDVGRENGKLTEEAQAPQRQFSALLPLLKKHKRLQERKELELGSQQIDLGANATVEVVATGGKLGPGTNAFEIAAKHKADFAKAPADDSALSAALEISLGDFELFLAGDLPGSDKKNRRYFHVRRGKTVVNAEGMLVDAWREGQRESDVEVFFASAHGSSYSNSQKLLAALDPEVILYSAGDGRHPIHTVVRRGGKTARQLATTRVGDDKLFEKSNGKVVGEIEILVSADGKSYRVNGEAYDALSDARESAAKGAPGTGEGAGRPDGAKVAPEIAPPAAPRPAAPRNAAPGATVAKPAPPAPKAAAPNSE
jgi:hypothetical protein